MHPFLRSFGFAWDGIRYALWTQRNMRVHLLIAALVIAAGIAVRLSGIEWALVSLAIGMVFSAEMFNTVAELAVDLLTEHYHPLAKIAKDTGAGAVLLAAIAAIGVGAGVFGPHVWQLMSGK
jgi:diacylglycerol kinase